MFSNEELTRIARDEATHRAAAQAAAAAKREDAARIREALAFYIQRVNWEFSPDEKADYLRLLDTL